MHYVHQMATGYHRDIPVLSGKLASKIAKTELYYYYYYYYYLYLPYIGYSLVCPRDKPCP